MMVRVVKFKHEDMTLYKVQKRFLFWWNDLTEPCPNALFGITERTLFFYSEDEAMKYVLNNFDDITWK